MLSDAKALTEIIEYNGGERRECALTSASLQLVPSLIPRVIFSSLLVNTTPNPHATRLSTHIHKSQWKFHQLTSNFSIQDLKRNIQSTSEVLNDLRYGTPQETSELNCMLNVNSLCGRPVIEPPALLKTVKGKSICRLHVAFVDVLHVCFETCRKRLGWAYQSMVAV